MIFPQFPICTAEFVTSLDVLIQLKEVCTDKENIIVKSISSSLG